MENTTRPTDYYSHKRYLFLNLINHLGPISRTELIALTDHRPASVGELIKDLIQEGLIMETGHYSKGHGRKRALLEINHSHICAMGISVSPTSVHYIVTQINGVILQQLETQIPGGQLHESLAEQITTQVQELLAQYAPKTIVGIGISEPLYDPVCYQKKGSLLSSYTHFNAWIHSDLKPRLERLLPIPVTTSSAITLPALAQQRFGLAKGARDFICVELSNGIGASICCNGSVVGGANGVAGEIGHTIINLNSTNRHLCYCGKPGCVEMDTAFPALVREIRAALSRGVFSVLNTCYDPSRELTVQDIRQALDENDQMCMYYVKQSASLIGVTIANAVNLLNPELVILHGFMLELGDYFVTQLSNSIRENVLILAKNFEIRTSSSLGNLLPLGAAAELFTAYFHMYDYQWVYEINSEIRKEKDTEET